MFRISCLRHVVVRQRLEMAPSSLYVSQFDVGPAIGVLETCG
jgi:hypothetical protein